MCPEESKSKAKTSSSGIKVNWALILIVYLKESLRPMNDWSFSGRTHVFTSKTEDCTEQKVD